jgi:hypothetical protein
MYIHTHTYMCTYIYIYICVYIYVLYIPYGDGSIGPSPGPKGRTNRRAGRQTQPPWLTCAPTHPPRVPPAPASHTGPAPPRLPRACPRSRSRPACTVSQCVPVPCRMPSAAHAHAFYACACGLTIFWDFAARSAIFAIMAQSFYVLSKPFWYSAQLFF